MDEKKSVFSRLSDRVVDVVYGREESVLPDVVGLAAVRDGDETQFSYREFCALPIENMRAMKEVLEWILPRRFPTASIVVTVYEPESEGRTPCIELSGKVPTVVFGQLMSNEFSHWTAIGSLSRRSIARMSRLIQLWLRLRGS